MTSIPQTPSPRTTDVISRALLALLLLAPPLSAQLVWPDEEGPWTPRPTQPAIVANDLRTRLGILAHDSMMGREAGTLGAFKASAYIAAEFQRMGLLPGGDNGSYFQELPLGPTGFDLLASRLAIGGTTLKPGSDWIPMNPSAPNGIVGTFAGRNITVVYGGVWGDTTTQLPASVKGKAVVFAQPPAPPAAAGRRAAGLARDRRAEQAGAALVLLAGLDQMNPALVANAFNRRIAMRPSTDAPSAGIPGAIISVATARSLFGDKHHDELTIGMAGSRISGNWNYQWTMAQYPARNVVGIVPGTDSLLRNQYVALSAHHDHVGVIPASQAIEHDSLRAFNTVMRPQGANDRPGPPSAGQWAEINALVARARSIRPPRIDSVFNGADDDGSGTAVLMEVAEQFAAGPAPKRSVLILSVTGEEKGLLGSRWWVDHPTVPLDSVVSAHNMDMLGKGRVTDVQFGGPAAIQMLGSRRLSSEFGDIIDSVNAVRSEPMVIDYSWDRTNKLNRFCRSDQVSFFSKEIPVTYFSLGYSRDYHQLTDEVQYIDFEHGARVGRFVHEIMTTVGNRPERIRVLPLAERDMSAQCGR
jgi:hypothetical protein